MEFTTREVKEAITKARNSTIVKDWSREDFCEENEFIGLTDEIIKEFASYVLVHYGNAILETLITDKAALEIRRIVIAERKAVGLNEPQ